MGAQYIALSVRGTMYNLAAIELFISFLYAYQCDDAFALRICINSNRVVEGQYFHSACGPFVVCSTDIFPYENPYTQTYTRAQVPHELWRA